MSNGVSLEHQILQLKEFMKTYQKVNQVCFMDCVKDFKNSDLSEAEKTCQHNCLKKYMSTTSRIAQRFSEYHLQTQESRMPPGADHGTGKF